MIKSILILFVLTVSLFSKDINIQSNIGYFEQKDSSSVDITKQNFLEYNVKKSNFGFTQSTYWLKVDIKNLSLDSKKTVLHLTYSLLDYIDIFELKDDKLILKRSYGDLREYKNDGLIPNPSFFVTLQSNESKTFFYKINTQGSMNLELIISSYKSYIKYAFEKVIIYSFYFGAIIIMLMYNFILYLFIKDKSYMYYLLFHINYLFFALSFNGITSSYFWPQSPSLNHFMVPLFMSLGSVLTALFTIEFLHIKIELPRMYKVLRIIFWINIIVTISIFVISYNYSLILASIMIFVNVIVITTTGLYSHFKVRNPYSKLFITAWGILLAGIFIGLLKSAGLIDENIITSYSAFIGAFFELTLLSIALAYRYNVQKQIIVKKDSLLSKQSKLASMGEMISNIAHQWRQPINRVNLSLEVIDEVIKDKNIDSQIINNKITNSRRNIEYMSQTIDDFSSFFSPNKKMENFKLNNAIHRSLFLIDSRLKNVKINILNKTDVEIFGFENEIIQVILVILNNAIDNFLIREIKQKIINISVDNINEKVIISIADNGGGIDEEKIDFIFDPYFTTKFKGEGTGIGLYMAKMLIENSMDGKLQVESSLGGVIFKIIIKRRLNDK